MKTKFDKIFEKRLKVARVKQLLNMVADGQITFSKMVQIINEEAGSLLMKEVTESDLEKLSKIASKYIIQGVNKKFFVSQYGIQQVLNTYLNSLNK